MEALLCISSGWNDAPQHEINYKKSLCHSYISLYFSKDCRSSLINDGIHFLHHIKVRFIIGILDTGSTPWHIG